MIKKTENLGITLLLALALTNFLGSEVYASNTLNQVDVRKSSADSLEFTMYTTSPYADNIVVTKKSDNKYVILMPNISDTSGATTNFAAVRDIVSDIDVRSISDGSSGYTKLTVTTNRPIDIKTNTMKSTAPSQSEREYRALIAQQHARPTQTSSSAETPQASTLTGFKLPEIQPTKSAADIVTTAATTVANVPKAPMTTTQTPAKTSQVKNVNSQTAKKTESKPAVKTVKAQAKTNTNSVKSAAVVPAVNKKTETKVSPVKAEAPVKEVSNKISETPKVEEKPVVKSVEDANIQKPVKEVSVVKTNEIQNPIDEIINSSFITAIKDKISSIDFQSVITDIKNEFSGRIPENMPVTLALVLVPIIAVMVLFNLIKGSLQKSQMLKKVLMENMAKRQNEVSSYDNIINNENLSWQEKYQQYREIAKDDEEDEMDESTKYSFIAQAPTGSNNSKPRELYQKGTIRPNQQVKSNIENLERLLQASPDIERTDIEEDIDELENETFIAPEVAMEENSIQEEITKTVKFKGFAEKMILEESHRNKKVKHRRVQLELPKEKEAPHVNLGYSQLHTNPRSFQGANLSVSDLIAKSNKILKIQPKEEPAVVKDYDMISVDEYLDMLDEDMAKVTSPLSEVVANKLSKIKDKTPVNKLETETVASSVTNPITSLRNDTKKDYLNGLIVKSGYNIDSEKGFYLVSLDGKSAVIGRIKEEIFVLKKFDKNIDKPLQVRMDNPNVYMVKADDFKSLVEVRKDDMGVLIEL